MALTRAQIEDLRTRCYWAPAPGAGVVAAQRDDVDELCDLALLALKLSSEPSELMLHAYRTALRRLIDGTPLAKRRWQKDGRGYRIPEREKAAARLAAMIAAARRELK